MRRGSTASAMPEFSSIPRTPLQGIIFAGRVVEDFKLTTGTFVHVGSLRTDAIAAATPVVQDALVAGQDRPYVGLLAWPNLHACRQIVGNPDASYEEVVRHPEVLACLKRGLRRITSRPRAPAACGSRAPC